ncbi:hypothetical protein D3C86_1722320 [compost metagenome]
MCQRNIQENPCFLKRNDPDVTRSFDLLEKEPPDHSHGSPPGEFTQKHQFHLSVHHIGFRRNTEPVPEFGGIGDRTQEEVSFDRFTGQDDLHPGWFVGEILFINQLSIPPESADMVFIEAFCNECIKAITAHSQKGFVIGQAGIHADAVQFVDILDGKRCFQRNL